jgi:hypothetical protein
MNTRKRNGSGKDELRREYDLAALKGGVRGKYYERAMAGTNLVLIEPDIAEVFPDSEAVNEALRGLINDRSHTRRGPALTARRNRRARRR